MLDFEQLFHSYCNIMSGTYKGIGTWEGDQVGGEGACAVKGRLYHLLTLFVVANGVHVI